MTDFPIHSETDHPEGSAEVISQVKANYGFVPNLLGALSEAPSVAKAYMDLGKALANSSLTPEERHVAWFTANTYHSCDYCMAAHTGMAKGEKISDEVIETARNGGTYSDPHLQALKEFVTAMLDDRGWVSSETVDKFLDAGFTKRNVHEVTLVLAHKTLSNYTNHLVHTPVDDAFQKFEWKPAAQAAE